MKLSIQEKTEREKMRGRRRKKGKGEEGAREVITGACKSSHLFLLRNNVWLERRLPV